MNSACISLVLTLDEVKDTFAFFDDWEDRYRYVIELGKSLPDMPIDERVEANLVRGCQSLVWLVMQYDARADRISIRLDSDAFIVRGLIAILLTVFQDRSPSHIVAVDVEQLFQELELFSHLTPTRGNGLKSMIARIKSEAAATLQRKSVTRH